MTFPGVSIPPISPSDGPNFSSHHHLDGRPLQPQPIDRTRWIELLLEANKRYRLIDHDKLRGLLNADTNEALAQTHLGWVESQLKTRPMRQAHFGRSLVVGSEAFIRSVKQALGIRAYLASI